MSRNATDDPDSASATLRATVLFPEPEPPAIPITSGLTNGWSVASPAVTACDVRAAAVEREAVTPSRFCIGASRSTDLTPSLVRVGADVDSGGIEASLRWESG